MPRQFLVRIAVYEAAIVAGRGGNVKVFGQFRAGVRDLAVQRTAFKADQFGQLLEHGRGELLRVLVRENIRAGINHAFQPAPVRLDRAHVAIAAQRGKHHRRKLLRGQLGFFLVVVDVVGRDDLLFRRLPRGRL